MSGIRGSGGPPPKRESQRRRKNKPAIPTTHAPGAENVPVPVADESWHPIARRWFEALPKSGQSLFYEPAEWESAWVLAESMSREFSEEGPIKAASLMAWAKIMSSLLVMEGDRRRVRLELERETPEDEVADVSELTEYRRRLKSG